MDNRFPIRDISDELDALNEHVHEPGDPDGVVAAEKQRRWKESHPKPHVDAPTPYKRRRLWPIVIGVVLLIAAAAFGAYWLGGHEASKKSHGSNTALPPKTQATSTQPVSVPTKHYDSTTFTLGFDYPENWTVNDTAAKLTVTSPAMPLQSAIGAKVNAHVIVTIQNQQTTISGYPSGGALAALGSDRITYKQPSSLQRAQTYVSYLSYTTPNGLDMLYVTGDHGYQQGQQVPMSDIVQGNPLIGVGFATCQTSTCATGSSNAVTLQASSWKSSSASQQVMNLLESIVIEG
jgi:hypothetical protein